MFELDGFIQNLRACLPEKSRRAMKEVVAKAVQNPESIIRALGRPEVPGAQVLYRGDDLTVVNVLWAPQQITLPHNHLITAIIGLYAGREDNLFWRRTASGQGFGIEAMGGQALGTGDVALLGRDIIHSVINPLPRISAAIHVYDGPFFEMARSMWDPETLTEQAYDVSAVTKGMSVR